MDQVALESFMIQQELREQQLEKATENSERDMMRSFPELALTIGNPPVQRM
ncbi:hypothetical protein [uncultured Rubinisphaera sp.]|uniref:hypothetical protein n=1 Tax=uncultured Rubinisphaera sp. TaxID=1678686 RepID=UPI0030DD90E1